MNDTPPSSPGPATRRLQWLLIPFASLTVPSYRPFWASSLLGYGAAQMLILARPWLAFELSGSALALGITVAGNAVPSLVLSPLAGALADRRSMRGIMLVSSVALMLLALLIAVDIWSGRIEWWHVAVLGTAQGVANAFESPTRIAIISQLVDRPRLLNAVSLNTVALNVTRMIGPLVAGVLIARVGVGSAYGLIAAAYAGSAIAIAMLPSIRRAPSETRGSITNDIAEAFRYALRQRVILRLLAVGLVASIFGQPFQHLLPLFQDVLAIGPEGLGLLVSFMGVGAFLGSLTAASLGDFRHKGLLLLGYMVLLGGAIILFSASAVYVLSLFLMVPLGFGHSGRTVLYQTTLHAYSHEHMRGRVLALNSMQHGLLPLTVLPITAAAEYVGVPLALGVSGAVVLGYGLWELLFARTVRGLE